MSPSTVPLVGVRGVTRVSEGHLPLLDQGGQVVGPRRGRRSTGELAELGQAQRTTLAEPQQRLSHHIGRHAALSLEWGGDGFQRAGSLCAMSGAVVLGAWAVVLGA